MADEPEQEINEHKDSITINTASQGGGIKVYFDYAKETPEEIEKKADFALNLALKLRTLWSMKVKTK